MGHKTVPCPICQGAMDSRSSMCWECFTQREAERIAERFWMKVDKSAGPDDCWLWISGMSNGYGRFGIRQGVIEYAHRMAWLLTKGPIPDGLFACHKCDNPRCVNPAHLFLGTHLDNIADRDAKGRVAKGDKAGARTKRENMPRGDIHWSKRTPERMPRGSARPDAKLTEADVCAIRARYSQGGTSYRLLGLEYRVDTYSIRAIIKRRSWRHVP